MWVAPAKPEQRYNVFSFFLLQRAFFWEDDMKKHNKFKSFKKGLQRYFYKRIEMTPFMLKSNFPDVKLIMSSLRDPRVSINY